MFCQYEISGRADDASYIHAKPRCKRLVELVESWRSRVSLMQLGEITWLRSLTMHLLNHEGIGKESFSPTLHRNGEQLCSVVKGQGRDGANVGRIEGDGLWRSGQRGSSPGGSRRALSTAPQARRRRRWPERRESEVDLSGSDPRSGPRPGAGERIRWWRWWSAGTWWGPSQTSCGA